MSARFPAVTRVRDGVRHRGVRAILLQVLALLCLALLFTGATALWGLHTVQLNVAATRTTITPLMDATHQVEATLLRAQTAARGYSVSGDQAFAREYAEATADLTAARDVLGEVAAGRLPQLRSLNESVDTWLGLTREPGRDTPRRSLDLPTTTSAMDRALGTLEDVRADASRLREERRADLNRSMTLAAAAVVTAAMLSIAVAFLALGRADRALGAPLLALQCTVARQRAGDHDAVAETSHGALEVVGLAASFNAFTREARDVVEQRERTLEQLTELNHQKSVFVSTTNHELRTPLTSISGYVEMLQDGDFGSVGPEQARVLEVVRRNTERLRLLIEDLLLINKLDQDRENRSARHRVMDLAECVSGVVTNLVPQAAAGEVTVHVDTDGSWPVFGDRDRLERAVTNVVGNAIKFTPPHGAVSLTLEGTSGGTGVRLTCTDTGMGIPEKEVGSLFTSFTRASNATAQQVPGTGLGLVIMRTIVEQHGGSVALESVEGEGTTVTLNLPLATQRSEPVQRVVATDAPSCSPE